MACKLFYSFWKDVIPDTFCFNMFQGQLTGTHVQHFLTGGTYSWSFMMLNEQAYGIAFMNITVMVDGCNCIFARNCPLTIIMHINWKWKENKSNIPLVFVFNRLHCCCFLPHNGAETRIVCLREARQRDAFIHLLMVRWQSIPWIGQGQWWWIGRITSRFPGSWGI